MWAMWITWNWRQSDFSWPPSIEDKVQIFYQRALGWQLHIADLLANGGEPLGESLPVPPVPHSGFAVLHICLSYFETIGHYEGRNPKTKRKKRSSKDFKEGVRSVFPELIDRHGEAAEPLLARLYDGVRCGLYHNSMTKRGVGLGPSSSDIPITYDVSTNVLTLNPEKLPKALKKHLEQFRGRLLDPRNVELRKNFECRFDEDNGIA